MRSAIWLFFFSQLLLAAGGFYIYLSIQQDSLATFFVLGTVIFGGVVACKHTQFGLKDPGLNVLGYFWLIKLGLTLLLLYAGWMPQLDPSSDAWGYDPQRFYFQAKELLDNNWSTEFLNLNYVGILYYYGAIYELLGFNPVIPALINALVTLVASLYLIKACYEIKGERGRSDWILAFVLLLPELLWFDVMTSRETLVGALITITLLTAVRYFARTVPISLPKLLSIAGFSVFAIAAVRTSMLLPLSLSFMFMLLSKQQGNTLALDRVLLFGFLVIVIIAAPQLASLVGGYEFDILNTISVVTTASQNVAFASDGWSQNSVGVLLLPDGILQSILYALPRMVIYWLAPLPNVYVPVSELLLGSWDAWQRLFTILSSILNVLIMPYVFASLFQSINSRRGHAAPFFLHLSYWITFMAIAGGNLIIQERYRVMATLLLYGCAWLGATTCPTRLVVKAGILWYGILAMGASLYLIYKYVV